MKREFGFQQTSSWPTTGLIAALMLAGCGGSESAGQELETIRQPLNVNNFQGFQQVTGITTTAGPAITSVSSNSRLAVVFDSNSNFSTNFWAGPAIGWLGWQAMPAGFFTSKPGATVWGNQHYAVVGKGSNDAIFINVTSGTGHMPWGTWRQIPGTGFNSAAAVAFTPAFSTTPPYLYVVARRTDGGAYWTRNPILNDMFDNSTWSTWALVPNGILTSEPALVADGSGVVLVGRGLDNAFWRTRFDGTSWQAWSQVPNGSFLSGPAITRRPSSGLLDVFGQGGDSQIWGSTFDGTSWDGFAPIPNGLTPSSPAAWSPASGVVDVLVRGTNGTVWVNRFQ